jgi:signal transduction histidine kinase/DNA-binding response OmpR family regulator/ligand-binding sensor domain-containing protein
MKRISVFLIILWITGWNYSHGFIIKSGNQRVERFVNAQGFFQNTVKAITSDSFGYLWFATSNGLVRYDGYTFEYFYLDPDNPESLSNNNLTHLLTDSSGNLWIGSMQGTCLYFGEQERFLRFGEAGKNVSLIKEDPKKRVWIAEDLTLRIFEQADQQPDSIKKTGEIDLNNLVEGNSIVDIEFWTESVLIVATNLKIYQLTISDELLSTDLTALPFDFMARNLRKLVKIENSLWIGTNSGLYQTVPDKSRLITVNSYLNADVSNNSQGYGILSLFLDKEQALWIGTERHGFLKYEHNKNDFISFEYDPKVDNGLTSNRINCFYEDAYGVMWIGTAQGGINKLDKHQKPFQNYSHNPYDDQSISDNLITDIREAKDGRIWFSFFEKTVCRTEEKIDPSGGQRIRFERMEQQLGQLKNQRIQSIFQDNRGYWWMGTTQDVYFYDEKQDKLKKIEFVAGDSTMYTSENRVITQIDDQHILIGGLQIYLLKDPWKLLENNQPVQVNSQLNLGINNLVFDLVKDDYGSYWFAARRGIFRTVFENGKMEIRYQLSASEGADSLRLSYNNIFSIHADSNNNIWLGSFGGGLTKIQLNSTGVPEKIKEYHKKDGLPDEAVYGILEDNHGIFWLPTDMGICRFDPHTEAFDVYNVNDGILNNNFRQSAFLKTKSGILLMGGLNGLTVFDPEKIIKNPVSPDVLITQLKINNQNIDPGKEYNGKVIIDRSISSSKKLVLIPKHRNISLDIIVQHSSAPQKNQLSYILEGVNSDWVNIAEGKATATYTNLNPGTYLFRYKGKNGDGIWSEQVRELSIEVLAPWYLRWWSMVIWVVLAVFIAWKIFDYLVRLEKLKQRLKFEELDNQRVHEMDQAKLRFFTNISHEFKTPLSLIIGPLEKIAWQNRNRENEKYFSIIHNNIARLQRLIDQIISYRKAETGNLELHFSKTTLGAFMYPILEAFEENAKRMNVNFFYKVFTPDREIVIDIDKAESILLNLFSNAVKFSGLNGNVSIEAGFEEGDGSPALLNIAVTNSGKGISNDNIERVFNRFFRGADSQGNLSGTGIGLALCKSLIELMKGTISVSSIPDEKTTFKVQLPLDSSLHPETMEGLKRQRNFVMDWIPDDTEVPERPDPDPDRPTLLIIDDEPDVRSFLKEVFEKKYHVILAVDGQDGMEKLKNSQPQLVICDLMMPNLSGYKVCETIKTDEATAHIPVILLTALNNDTNKLEGLELGADDYITKPFSIRHLEVRVKNMIENKQKIFQYFAKNSFVPKDNLSFSVQDRQFLIKVEGIMEKNLSDSNFGVEELAREAGMSTSHFYRRLKQTTGQVPNVYLRNFRLQKASELLRANKDMTAMEVMYEIGIESPSYFSTSFKKLHGVSPSEFTRHIKD